MRSSALRTECEFPPTLSRTPNKLVLIARHAGERGGGEVM